MLADRVKAIKEETDADMSNKLNPKDAIPVEDLDDDYNKVIVFDGIKIDEKHGCT